MWYAIGGIVFVIAAFLVWRVTSVGRGMRQRDRKLFKVLHPFYERLAGGAAVDVDEIRRLCGRYELRPMLYHMLINFSKTDLFPEEYTSWESQAEGLLAQWMMHPNELEAAPARMECVARVVRDIGGREGTFVVVKYKMAAGHWAGEDWILGLAGPFVESEGPYRGLAGAFSRCGDREGEVAPEALVDWFVDVCRRKCG
jgi:hypothetical protein